MLLGETIKRGLMVTMLLGEGKNIQTIIEAMAQHEEIETIRIFDTQGRIKKSSRLREIGAFVPSSLVEAGLRDQPQVFRDKGIDGEPVFTSLQRIDNLAQCHRCHGSDHKVRGILELQVTLAGVLAEVDAQRTRLIWTAAGTFLFLSVGLWFMLLRVVAGPVEQLSLAMQTAQGGDLSVRAPEGGPEEIALLGRGLNSTLAALSEARRKFEEARHAEMLHMERLASIGEMASGIAHDIKNPLAGIAGSAEVIRDQLPRDDPRKEVLNAILSHVQRLHHSIEGVLSYVRITPPHRIAIPLKNLLDRLLLLCGPEFEKKSIAVRVDTPDSLPLLRVDTERIQQALMNLTINAVQAMGKGGTLDFSAREILAGRVELRISDTGVGIPSENLNKIFEPFYTTREKGTGLGLATTRRIIEEHDGQITVESTPGAGTTFIIVLEAAP